jgi:hypothetical protein
MSTNRITEGARVPDQLRLMVKGLMAMRGINLQTAYTGLLLWAARNPQEAAGVIRAEVAVPFDSPVEIQPRPLRGRGNRKQPIRNRPFSRVPPGGRSGAPAQVGLRRASVK